MLNKPFLVSVSLAVVVFSGAATAAPKSASPARPGVLAPHLRPFQPNARQPRSYIPNMTRMPDSHIISAFDMTVPGERLYKDASGRVIQVIGEPREQVYTDISGRIIGRGSPASSGGIVWLNPNPRFAKSNR